MSVNRENYQHTGNVLLGSGCTSANGYVLGDAEIQNSVKLLAGTDITFLIKNKNYADTLMIVNASEDEDYTTDELFIKRVNETIKQLEVLRDDYNVVAIVTSGNADNFKTKTFIQPKGEEYSIVNYNGILKDLHIYFKIFTISKNEFTKEINNKTTNNLILALNRIKKDINQIMYECGDLTSDTRMNLIGAAILALRHKEFRENLDNYNNDELLSRCRDAVIKYLDTLNLDVDKQFYIVSQVKSLENQNSIKTGVMNSDGIIRNPLKEILNILHKGPINEVGIRVPNKDIIGIIEATVDLHDFNIDIMGEFYNEFITHGKDDGNAKGGFVLTPRHICELFAELGEVNKDTKMLDMCFGSAGFLVAGMKKAIDDANGDKDAIKNIKDNNIYGVELNPNRYAYGAINMILRGDGHSHMECGDCFNLGKEMERCDVGFINPPYAIQPKELKFVENMLDTLKVGGRGIAIIPMSCATNKVNTELKQDILSKHTLEAVLSMPDQLFYPTGVVTCIMVFTAGIPHDISKETWFARCKDDGFEINKTAGRIDAKGKWKGIKKQWIDAFIDRDIINNFNVKQAVTANDEWSYEAYAKTDFSGITEESFKNVVKEYALFQLSQLEV